MFGNGIKFVILDEVDYMTTNAQIALRYLLTSYTDNNVRFCLICNYVSRIDESLQTEFVRMRFNQLPETDILAFLRKIRDNENLNLSDMNLVAIQRQFHSDIRSMINYIQTNQDNLQELHVITNAVWDKMVDLFRDPVCDIQTITLYFREIGAMYYIDPRTIIKNFLYYIVRYRSSEMMVSPELLNSAEHIIHLCNIKNEYIIHYFILKFRAYFQGLVGRCSVASSPPPVAATTAATVKKRIIKIKKQHVSI
jgi:DNA polymerase III delta prime subunit